MRKATPAPFIFILENVLPTGDETSVSKGQWLRAQKELEEIFGYAGLKIFNKPERHSMPANYEDIVVWALY